MKEMSNEHVCRVCGGPAIAGTMDCPHCQNAIRNREMRAGSCREMRPYWNNASHDGPPAGFRIVGGRYDGMIVKTVK